jgi:EAL domain-containing protein (putative c-di-GMP-specific phosphodiesterase class I)
MQVELAMGYAVQSDHLTTGDDLVRQADLAMYEAKRQNARGPVAFNSLIRQATLDAFEVEKGLRRALISSGQLSVAYQPIVDTTGRLVRAEALARWTSPELGSVPPDRFIGVAEQAGLIGDLGRLLLRLVCDDLVAHPRLCVSINVSPLQLMAPDYVPSLIDELRERAIDPSRIEIELTESVLVDDPRLASERLAELRIAGFSIALDDFGTGYSSVGYLGQFRFDTLKIDRSFVANIRSSDHGITVVDGMIRMAHGYQLKVVCEGIESPEEFATLCELGCDLGQGFHISRPVQVHVLAAQLAGQVFREANVA